MSRPKASGGLLRAGLAGCGAIGSGYDEGRAGRQVYTHAGMYSRLPMFELAAMADPDPERLARAGGCWGTRGLYPGVERMLREEELDVLSVATPDRTHPEVLECVLAAARRPKVVFMEKPIAGTSAEAAGLARRCAKAGVTLVVDNIRRWDANTRGVREYLLSGKLGRVETVVAHYVRGVRHNGCQAVNLLRFLLGEVGRVQALPPFDGGSLPGDPSLNVRLEFSSGAQGMLLGHDRRGYAYSIFELDVFGSGGRVSMRDAARRIRLHHVSRDAEFTNFSSLVPQANPWPRSTYGQAMLHAGRELGRLALGLATVSANPASEAVRDMAVLEAACRSAADGGRIATVGYPRGFNTESQGSAYEPAGD